MAMTTCRECGQPVSDQAPTCPHCGIDRPGSRPAPSPAPAPAPASTLTPEPAAKPKETSNTAKGCLVLILIIVFVPTLARVCSGDTDTGSSKPKATTAARKEPAATPTESKEQKAAKEAACREDLACWAERHNFEATVTCQRVIEGMAKYDFEWTDGWLEPKLSRYKWKNQKAGTITYFGDKIKLQNGFGAWQNQIYACDYDTIDKAVIDVNLEAGRIPQ